MSVLDRIIASIAPFDCVGCGAEGRLLCQICSAKILVPDAVCFRCLKPMTDNQTCGDCVQVTNLAALRQASTYSDVAKALVWRLKFTGARRAADEMALCLAAVNRPQRGVYIVPVPTATSRVRQRGYDQAALLAQAYAKRTGNTYLACLARLGHMQQRGASRSARLQQLGGQYRITNRRLLQGARVLLVDDVATTGATLQAAAETLHSAGVINIEAIVFARA